MVTEGNGQAQKLPHPRCAARGTEHQYDFVPQDDITALEVAGAMELLMFGTLGIIGAMPPQVIDVLFASLPEEARRHWRVRKLSKIAEVKRPNRLQLPPGAMG